jgi:hypothetical protein
MAQHGGKVGVQRVLAGSPKWRLTWGNTLGQAARPRRRDTTLGSRGGTLYTKHNAKLVFKRDGHSVSAFVECLDNDESCSSLIDMGFDAIRPT